MVPFRNFMCTDAQLPHAFGIWLNTGQFLMRSTRLFWALMSYPVLLQSYIMPGKIFLNFSTGVKCINQSWCHIRLTQQHQQQWLSSLLSVSLSMKCCWASETQIKLYKMSHWHPKIRPETICIKMMGIILSGCLLNQANFRQLERINVNVISFLARKQSSTCLSIVYTLKSSRVRCKGQCPLVEWLL